MTEEDLDRKRRSINIIGLKHYQNISKMMGEDFYDFIHKDKNLKISMSDDVEDLFFKKTEDGILMIEGETEMLLVLLGGSIRPEKLTLPSRVIEVTEENYFDVIDKMQDFISQWIMNLAKNGFYNPKERIYL